MQTLFAISILSFLGILWAALALARRIKASQIHSVSFAPHQPDFKHHLLSVVPVVSRQDESLRIAPTSSKVSALDPLPALAAKDTNPALLPVAESAPIAARTRLNGLNQSVHDIAANKQWILPPHPVRSMRLELERIGRPRKASETSRSLIPARKPPQPTSRTGVVHRLDPAYFNKDLGDLTDPYQPPARLRANERHHMQ